ncbi:MAG: protoheme IX farnesyltransferase [Actinobacteria bacterium]|nr:protoheme IX farnesyltransferase [Actinomycetota bacterium]
MASAPTLDETRVTDRIRSYIAMTKPRIIELLLVTAIPTMFLAAEGLPTLRSAIAVLVGGAAAAAAANTFNSVYDRDVDAVMARTHDRPLARGAVSLRAGLIQGSILTVVSALVLALLTNPLAAGLSLVAIALYSVGYTMILKRRTTQNIVWGGAAGCMPVLIAWAAITGSLTWTPVVLFLVVFFWTPPHYWPLAMKYREEYRQAGIPMLPVVATDRVVARQIIVYSWVMVAVSLALVPVAGMGVVYLVGAAALGALFLVLAYRVRSSVGSADLDRRAMRLFHGSITYLAILFLLVGVDPFLGW